MKLAASVSVIIPVLNEAGRLGGLIESLLAQPEIGEVIVADGGSVDGSLRLAEEAGAVAFSAPPGRGPQLAAGAARATGDILWFVHADTQVPEGAAAAIHAYLLAHPDCPGGNFRLLFDGQDGFSLWLNGFYAWIRRNGFYYGDSGIFVRREVCTAIGGVRPLDLMEDYDLIRRLERAGPTVCLETPPLVTSSRRFKNRSALAIVSQWFTLHALYHCAAPSRWLAQLYDSSRTTRPH